MKRIKGKAEKIVQMKRKASISPLFLLIFTLGFASDFAPVFAKEPGVSQTESWQTESLDGGKISVSWNVTEDSEGYPLIEYITQTTTGIDLESLVSVLKDIGKHRTLLDTAGVKLLEKVSGNQWNIYYHYSALWPLSDSEVASKMVFQENNSAHSATFYITADPSIDIPENEERLRMKLSNFIYTFSQTGEHEVSITIDSRTIAPQKVPVWAINAMFPEIGADVMRRLLRLAHETGNGNMKNNAGFTTK